MGFVFPRGELASLPFNMGGLLALGLGVFQLDEERLMNFIPENRHHKSDVVELMGFQLNALKPRKGVTTQDQADVARLLAESNARYFREDHTVRDRDGNIVFTGKAQIREDGKYVEKSSINAAKRWIRAQVGLGGPISINV